MIVFSTLVYALGKAVGVQQAAAMFHQWVQNPGRDPQLDCLTTLRALQIAVGADDQIAVLCDTGGSHISKARSRHFSLALENLADVWIACDDDVAITDGTARRLLQSVRCDEPRIVIVPCALRGAQKSALVGSRGEALLGDPTSCNIQWDAFPEPPPHEWLRRAHYGGFGCVAVNRAALELVAGASRKYRELGRVWTGAFEDDWEQEIDSEVWRWYGEDVSFFRRAACPVFGLVEGSSTHAGLTLDLGQFK